MKIYLTGHAIDRGAYVTELGRECISDRRCARSHFSEIINCDKLSRN